MGWRRRFETAGEQTTANGLQRLHLPGLRYSLRMVSPDVMEVARIDNGILRAIMWGMFCLMAFFLFQSWSENDVLWGHVMYLVDPEAHLRPQYERWIARGADFPSFEVWFQEMMDIHGHRWIGGLIYLALPTFFFYAAAIWPKYRPVRFDRARGVAYTWSWGRFFITSLDNDVRDLDMTIRGTSILPSENARDPELIHYGPLMIRLRHHRWTKYRERWPLGIFPPSHAGQNSQIAFAIRDFMLSYSRPDWCDRLEDQPPYSLFDRFLMAAFNFSLLPTWWPKRTEAMIERHLAQQSRNRGVP